MRAEWNFSLFVSGQAEMNKEKLRLVESRLYVVTEIFCTLELEKTRYKSQDASSNHTRNDEFFVVRCSVRSIRI